MKLRETNQLNSLLTLPKTHAKMNTSKQVRIPRCVGDANLNSTVVARLTYAFRVITTRGLIVAGVGGRAAAEMDAKNLLSLAKT